MTIVFIALQPNAILAQHIEIYAPTELPLVARFGESISITSRIETGNHTLIVGVPLGTPDLPAFAAGSAFVYEAPEWIESLKISAPDSSAGDLFGYSVSLGYYGAMVGAPGAEKAYVYYDPANLDKITQLDGSSAGAESQFGFAVEWLDSSLLASAPNAEGGGAVLIYYEYAYRFSNPEIDIPKQTLRPSNPNDHRFGHDISGGRGNIISGPFSFAARIAVGAPGDGTQPGAVYIYRLTRQETWEEEARIEGPPLFGAQVEIGNGRLAVLYSEPQQNRVMIYGQMPDDSWVPVDTIDTMHSSANNFGSSLALAGESSRYDTWQLLVGTPGIASDAPVSPEAIQSDIIKSSHISTGILLPEPTGEYGHAVTVSPVNERVWAISDPAYTGKGAVVLGTAFPVSSEAEIPKESVLSFSVPSPHPIVSAGEVELYLPSPGNVKLSIFDLLGREVDIVLDRSLTPGQHRVHLNVHSLSPGLYLLAAETHDQKISQPFVVSR